MPQIIPIRELKNTAEMSRMCHEKDEPIYITKNGYGDMVIMSVAAYEERLAWADIEQKLSIAEQQAAEGRLESASKTANKLREKYGL